jgi:hypothetical protein
MSCGMQRVLEMVQQCSSLSVSSWKIKNSCGQSIRQRICKGEEDPRYKGFIAATSEIIFTKLDQETGYIIIIRLFHHLPVF